MVRSFEAWLEGLRRPPTDIHVTLSGPDFRQISEENVGNCSRNMEKASHSRPPAGESEQQLLT